MTLRAYLTCFMLLGVAVPAQAAGVLYDCTITKTRQGGGWISEKVAIVLKEDGKAVVSDAVILHFNKQPMPARISRNNDRKLAVHWRLNAVVNSSNQTTPAFEYMATVTKASNKISVYAKPEGYSNRFNGTGSCVLKAAK